MNGFKIYGPRLYAVRGATCVTENTAQTMLSATRELVKALLEKNRVQRDAVVSMLFTVTPDLDAAFPAQAAHIFHLPCALMCAQEIPVPGSMARVIRVMLTYYSSEVPCPVYLNGTDVLLERYDHARFESGEVD